MDNANDKNRALQIEAGLQPRCWAFEVPLNQLDDVRTWYGHVNNDRAEQMQQHMRNWEMTRYKAWIQTIEQRAWIVEYWLAQPGSGREIMSKKNESQDDFTRWCLSWRERLHHGQFNLFKGLRHVIDYPHADTFVNQDQVVASVMPLLPHQYQVCIATIDDWVRHQSDAMEDYCNRLGILQWRAWIQRVANDHFVVQSHVFSDNVNTQTFYDRYCQEKQGFVEQVRQFGLSCYGVDFNNPKVWRQLEECCHVTCFSH